MEIKLSVVIPVYNTEKYLERCLKSIIGQSLKEIEIILVNDGSTDNSLNIIKKFQEIDKRIIVIDKENGGVAAARNSGQEIANGEYTIHLDGDDWIEQNYFLELYSKAKKYDLDIIFSDFYFDWDNGNKKLIKNLQLEEEEFINYNQYLQEYFKMKISPLTWDKMIKTSLYKENNIKYPVGVVHQDGLATLELAKHAKRIGKINKAYVHYIQNPGSVMHKNWMEKINELVKILEYLENEYRGKIENKIMEEYKIYSLSLPLFGNDYNIENEKYQYAITYYIEKIKKLGIIKNMNKKMMVYSVLLNISPTFHMFKYIYGFNKQMRKMKEKYLEGKYGCKN